MYEYQVLIVHENPRKSLPTIPSINHFSFHLKKNILNLNLWAGFLIIFVLIFSFTKSTVFFFTLLWLFVLLAIAKDQTWFTMFARLRLVSKKAQKRICESGRAGTEWVRQGKEVLPVHPVQDPSFSLLGLHLGKCSQRHADWLRRTKDELLNIYWRITCFWLATWPHVGPIFLAGTAANSGRIFLAAISATITTS